MLGDACGGDEVFGLEVGENHDDELVYVCESGDGAGGGHGAGGQGRDVGACGGGGGIRKGMRMPRADIYTSHCRPASYRNR